MKNGCSENLCEIRPIEAHDLDDSINLKNIRVASVGKW